MAELRGSLHVENGKYCEINFELSGVDKFDILIFFDSIKDWVVPNNKLMTSVEKAELKNKLETWLTSKNIKAEI